MKKFLVTCFLLLVILGSFSFVWLKTQAAGPDDNYFNRQLRLKFAANPALRRILGLHYDGDARADYLGERYKKILIEVDLMEAAPARIAALDLLRQRTQEITGKETAYILSDKNIPFERVVDDSGIARVASKYRSHFSAGDTAVVYALYASRMADEKDLLGLTFQEYGIVLFAETLAGFAGINLEVLPLYEASTLLHEFGHQLGLPHNRVEGCLMNESADQAVVLREDPEDVLTDFCEYEKRLLSNFRNQ